MGIIIRTLYNNQNWRALCKQPRPYNECKRCFKPKEAILGPSPSDEVCTGNCWERNICVKYRWGCNPKGRKFGGRAYIGMKVFFVYKQPGGKQALYTLWGKTTVQSIDDKVVAEGQDDEKGFAFMYFISFVPLPKEKWVRNLTDRELVGEKWLQGAFRYVDTARETRLEQLIEGEKADRPVESPAITIPPTDTILTIRIMPNIEEKLDRIANAEGRQKDEIVREAIAEWLKGREL